MFSTDLHVNSLLSLWLQNHLDATPDDRMAERPEMNHAAWQIGHLAVAADFGIVGLGGTFELRRWTVKFGPGTMPTGTRSDYPSQAELVETFNRKQAQLCKLASEPIDPVLLAAPNSFELLKAHLPTIRDVTSYLLNGHFGMHVGQYSAWRKACGIGS
jgi:hypothetical protein